LFSFLVITSFPAAVVIFSLTFTQHGVIIGRVKVREKMTTAAGKEVMTRKENKAGTTGEGMCL
jgi:hypothetical protein